MTHLYELVCVLDANLGTKEITALKDKIEKALSDIKDTDDMGLLPLAYPLRGQDQAYFISYHIGVPADEMEELDTLLRLEKGVAKYVFYSMKEQDAFLHFADLKKSYDTLAKEQEAALEEEAESLDTEDEEEAESAEA